MAATTRSEATRVFALLLRVGGGRQFRVAFSHRLSFQIDAVGAVHDPIEDRVSEGVIADDLMPMIDRQLAGDDMVKGSRREEILRLATSLEADLVVVGTAARSGFTAVVIQSAAECIAKSLDCSVLVVKPPGFITPVVVEEP